MFPTSSLSATMLKFWTSVIVEQFWFNLFLTVQVGGAPVSPVPGSQQWKVTTGGRGWPGPGLCCDQLWMLDHVISDNQSQLRPHHRILIVQLESSRVLFPVSFWSLCKFLYYINVQPYIFIINLKVKMKFNLPKRSEGQIIDDIHYWQYRVCTHRAQRALLRLGWVISFKIIDLRVERQ